MLHQHFLWEGAFFVHVEVSNCSKSNFNAMIWCNVLWRHQRGK